MASEPDQPSKETDPTLPQEAQELKPIALLPAVNVTPADGMNLLCFVWLCLNVGLGMLSGEITGDIKL